MNDSISITIGKRINALLAEQSKKQKELAKYLGVQDNTISYFVSGRRTPNAELIIKISDFFNVSTDYLLGRTDVKTEAKKVDKKKFVENELLALLQAIDSRVKSADYLGYIDGGEYVSIGILIDGTIETETICLVSDTLAGIATDVIDYLFQQNEKQRGKEKMRKKSEIAVNILLYVSGSVTGAIIGAIIINTILPI